MKFFEYGEENEKTLLIECGYLAEWNPGLQPFIQKAGKKYHVIVYLVCGIVKESAPDETSAEMMRLFSSMDERMKEIMLIQMRALVMAKRK